MTESNPVVVACIPAYYGERGMVAVVDRDGNCVDGVEIAVLSVEPVRIWRSWGGLRSDFARVMEESVYRMARSISEVAVKLGHEAAAVWARDLGFMRYLAALSFYKLSGWGS